MHDKILKLEKHPFNIFPLMTADERKQVRLDIEQYGYDSSYPIVLYQDKVLDGWNRQQICEEIRVTPLYKKFSGNDMEAMDFIWRSNRRRNLTSSQWSVIATEAQPIMEAITAAVKKEKTEKLEGNQNASAEKQLVESIPPTENPKRDDSKRSAVKMAKQFHTNPKYVAKAKEIKTSKPDVFELVKNGELSIPEVIRAEKIEALESRKKMTDAINVRAGELKASDETSAMNEGSIPNEPTPRLTELTIEIREDLLIKIKAFAKAQNVEMKLHEWDLDYKQVAVDLLSIGVENPPFRYDVEAMKVFNEEIQRLTEKLTVS